MNGASSKGRAAELISIFLSIFFALVIIFAVRIELHGASSTPLLYYNDKAWEREDKLPIEKVKATYYIPAAIFAQLDGFEVSTNSKQRTFIIEYNDGELFLSFDMTSGFALNQDDSQMYIPTYEFYGEFYVPAKDICKRFGLTFEKLTSPVTGEIALRISDSSAEMSFIELIRSKYSGFYVPQTTQKVTEPPITETDPPESTTTAGTTIETDEPQPTLGDRIIYITIEDSPSEHTEAILELLKKYDCPATFFVIGRSSLENPRLLGSIVGAGHTLALHTMEHDISLFDTAEDIIADIEAENELIAGYTKKKTNIWRAPGGSSSLALLDRNAELMINHAGYTVWDWNVEAIGDTAEEAAEAAIDGIWNNETAVIRIIDDENAKETLEIILEFINENREVCELRTISAAQYEYNFITG